MIIAPGTSEPEFGPGVSIGLTGEEVAKVRYMAIGYLPNHVEGRGQDLDERLPVESEADAIQYLKEHYSDYGYVELWCEKYMDDVFVGAFWAGQGWIPASGPYRSSNKKPRNDYFRMQRKLSRSRQKRKESSCPTK